MGDMLRKILRPHLNSWAKKVDPLGTKIMTKVDKQWLDPTFDPNSPLLRGPPPPDYMKMYEEGRLPGQPGGSVSALKCGGKVKRKKFSKGGSVDDLAPRENLPAKNASEQAKDAKRKKPKPEDDLAPRENLPTKRYAKGGMVRGDGCCVKGKTKGRFC